MLARRSALDPPARSAADREIRDLLANLVRRLPAGATVAGYSPMPAEPGGPALVPALHGALPAGGRLLLPLLRPDLDLDWAEYSGVLVPGPRGTCEPAGPRLDPGTVTAADLVIVPAVAVDRTGVRLGRGGGSYDRVLARLGTTERVLAVGYRGELVDWLPAATHDVRVGAFADPAGITRFTGRDAGFLSGSTGQPEHN